MGAEACLLRPESTPMCSAVHSGRGSRAFYGQKARLCARGQVGAWPKEGVPGYSSRGIFADNRNNFYPFIFSKIGINAEDLSITLRLVSL